MYFSGSDRVLTGSFDGTVRFWKVHLDSGKNEGECLHVLRGAEMTEVQTAQFSPDFLLAAAGSSDATATVYDLTSGESQTEFRHTVTHCLKYNAYFMCSCFLQELPCTRLMATMPKLAPWALITRARPYLRVRSTPA